MTRRTRPENFWRHVGRGGDDECWPYLGARTTTGYGDCTYGRQQWKAHRLAWTLTNGPIADGLHVCHACDNKLCCNPAHLFLGTRFDNLRDAAQKGLLSVPHLGGRGEHSSQSKLTEEQVRDIRRRYAAGETLTSIAATHGVTRANCGYIVRRVTWQSVP
jgi:hypothetical protein